MKYLLPLIILVSSLVSCDEDAKEAIEPSFASTAAFSLSGDGYDETIFYNSDNNLVFSQLFKNNEMWIRLAADQSANGENGKHIDIDICNFSGSGTYSPIDPQTRPCTKSGWDIWWHDGAKIYFNQENSTPCNLTLTQNGDTLSGVFACDQVILKDGASFIQISSGSFKTLIDRK